jgi:SPIRAL1-like protein
MGRGNSSGGGQSSLGYLFGSGEAPKPAATTNAQPEVQPANDAPPSKPAAAPKAIDPSKPAGINSNSIDGLNTGNFITVLVVLVIYNLFFFMLSVIRVIVKD